MYDIATSFIHAGKTTDPATGAVNIPIYQTSTFRQERLGANPEWEYSRSGNPTRAALERLIAELEGGQAGFAFSSGLAALNTVFSLLTTGDEVVISRSVYGGTFRLLAEVFNHFGITYRIAPSEDPAQIEQTFTPATKAIVIESPSNPLLSITDIRAVADSAHRHGALVIVDNTFLTPFFQRPHELGADIVVHSATKYLGGHSDLIAGLVTTNDEDLAQRLGFLQNASGAVLSPFDSFLLIRGIKTLGVRMERHAHNAERVARSLEDNPAVSRVYYPGLEHHEGYEVNAQQSASGGAMVSFELADTYSYERFFENVQLVALAESLGGVESLVCHPASMTHASIPQEIREEIGITDNLIRLSVGIESADDIISDLTRAIERARM